MSSTHPDSDTVRAALALAVRAPSVHNTQPWQWRIGETSVHLYADESRHLPATDPDGRDLLVSCGAALDHFRVAARATGFETIVHRLPNPADTSHLAAIEFRAVPVEADAERLARAIPQRRSDRRRFTSWEIPPARLEELRESAADAGGLLVDTGSGRIRTRLIEAFEQAAADHRCDLAYEAELARWSGRYAAAEGVPARNAVLADRPSTRRFAAPGLAEVVVRDLDGTERLLVMAATGDDRISRLRAGEAMSAVLLTATAGGLASCPLTEPLELPSTRDIIRTDVLGDCGSPQVVLRMGWAATTADPVSATPRRPLDDVVRPL